MKKFFLAACAAFALLTSAVQVQAMPVTSMVQVEDGSLEGIGALNDIRTFFEMSVTDLGGGYFKYEAAGTSAFGANENLRTMSTLSVEPLTVTKLFLQLNESVLQEHILQASAPFEVNNHNLGPFTMYGVLFDVNFTSGFDVTFVSGEGGLGSALMRGVDGEGNDTYVYNAVMNDFVSPFEDPAPFGQVYTVNAPPPAPNGVPEPATLALAVPFLFWLVGKAMIRQRKPAVAKV